MEEKKLLRTNNIKNKTLNLTNVLYKLFLITSIYSFLYVLYNNDNASYKLLFLIPLSYFFLNFLLRIRVQYLKDNIGLLLLNIIMFLRYVIMPLIIVWSGNYEGYGPEPLSDSMNLAIFLAVYEMFLVYIAIKIFSPIFYNKQTLNNKNDNFIPIKSKMIISLLIIIAILMVGAFPQILNKYNFFIITSELGKTPDLNIQLSGIPFLVVGWAKLILPILFISYFKKKHDKTGKDRYIFLSSIAILSNVLIFSGNSRFSLLVPGITSIAFLRMLYPSRKKQLTIFISAMLAFSLISLSAYKMFGETTNSIYTLGLERHWLSNMMQVYLSGPRNIAIAIETKSMFYESISASTLLNDMLHSVAFFSRFTNFGGTSISYFNYRVYNHTLYADQIIPMVGQSYIYFGLVGAPIITVLFVILMMFFESRRNKEKRIEICFLYTYVSVWLACVMMVNLSIITSFLTNTFSMLLLISFINRKLVLNKSYGGKLT